MRQIGLWMACCALALAFGCDNGRSVTGTDGGGIVLPDTGPPPPPDSGMTVRPDGGPPPVSCGSQATFQACAECFCNENMGGCNAYLAALIGNLYCGATCSADCAPICADPAAMAPAACNTCVGGIGDGNSDLDGFRSACMADSGCVNFASTLQACPM